MKGVMKGGWGMQLAPQTFLQTDNSLKEEKNRELIGGGWVTIAQ